jgi:hypothetical protein
MTAGRSEPAPATGGAGDGVRDRQRIMAELLGQLLARAHGHLSREAVAVAAELLDVAQLAAGDVLRRRLEELVWEQIDAGADRHILAPLTQRLGFSDEAIAAGVVAS